jgi:tetratricopeptide (TPR) repeat protein
LVSIEDLLERVQQAETETERQWILLELQMSQMSDELVSMLWAAAIPHFFDAQVLAALRPELADRAVTLYADLTTLTFVEDFPGHGSNIHELTRGVLLSQLWKQDQGEFLRLSKRAADYFFDMRKSSEEDVEFSYHEILSEGTAQAGRLLDRAIDWWNYYQIERIQSALQGFSEHQKTGRLDEFGTGFSLHLNGLVKRSSANYQEAEFYFSRAQTIYESIKLVNPRYITTLLRDLSSSKSDQGSNESAANICEQSLRISEEQLGKNHPDTATSLNNLAILYQDTGRYQEAEPLFLQALKIEEQLRENHPNTANYLNNLAILYQDTGRYQEAESLFLQALKIRKEQLGETHPDTAANLNNLASLYQDTGRYQEAESLFLQALKIEEQLRETHPNTANYLNNLAILYQDTGRYQEAESFFLQALKIWKEQLGETHPDTATSLNNLASLYRDTGRYQEAEPLFLQALKIWKEQLGETHPNIATSLNNLASLYRGTGRYQEAEPLFLQALKIRKEQLGENHPDTAASLNNLASLYRDTGRYQEAEPLFLQALKIEEQLGENHSNTANYLNNLAILYKDTGRYQEAEPLFLQALKIEEQLGENHPNTAASLNNLAGLYQKQERYSEAISMIERWKGIKRERQETQNRYFAERICTLGRLYETCQRFPEAVITYEEALSIFNQILGSKHLRTLVLKGELGRLKKRMGNEAKRNK